eukprot:jgi/Chrzof1/2513/Cz11g18120.t1
MVDCEPSPKDRRTEPDGTQTPDTKDLPASLLSLSDDEHQAVSSLGYNCRMASHTHSSYQELGNRQSHQRYPSSTQAYTQPGMQAAGPRHSSTAALNGQRPSAPSSAGQMPPDVVSSSRDTVYLPASHKQPSMHDQYSTRTRVPLAVATQAPSRQACTDQGVHTSKQHNEYKLQLPDEDDLFSDVLTIKTPTASPPRIRQEVYVKAGSGTAVHKHAPSRHMPQQQQQQQQAPPPPPPRPPVQPHPATTTTSRTQQRQAQQGGSTQQAKQQPPPQQHTRPELPEDEDELLGITSSSSHGHSSSTSSNSKVSSNGYYQHKQETAPSTTNGKVADRSDANRGSNSTAPSKLNRSASGTNSHAAAADSNSNSNSINSSSSQPPPPPPYPPPPPRRTGHDDVASGGNSNSMCRTSSTSDSSGHSMPHGPPPSQPMPMAMPYGHMGMHGGPLIMSPMGLVASPMGPMGPMVPIMAPTMPMAHMGMGLVPLGMPMMVPVAHMPPGMHGHGYMPPGHHMMGGGVGGNVAPPRMPPGPPSSKRLEIKDPNKKKELGAVARGNGKGSHAVKAAALADSKPKDSTAADSHQVASA